MSEGRSADKGKIVIYKLLYYLGNNMDLKIYLSIFWGNKWIILTSLLVTLLATIVGTMLITPVYSASTTLRVATTSSGSISYYDYVSIDRLMNTYTKIATSGPILEELDHRVNPIDDLDVRVSMISSTELIQITVKNTNPYVARDAANALAEILIEQSQELYSGGEKSTTEILLEQLTFAEEELRQAHLAYETLVTDSPGDAESIEKASMLVDLKTGTYETLLNQYEQARLREVLRSNTITIVEPALLPQEPAQPKLGLNILVGAVVGLVGGLGLVFLFEYLNPRLYTIDQVEEVTELSVIGKIPAMSRRGITTLLSLRNKHRRAAFKEAFQKLYSRLSQLRTNGDSIKSLLVTSASPGEGKSTVATHLALTMAQAGQKVILIDGDLRRPTLHKLHGLSNEIGLSSFLNKQATKTQITQNTRYENLALIPSGPVAANPMELLGSSQMITLIASLSSKYDLVLLDSPAFLPVGDALLLAPLVDAMVLIVRQNISKEDTVREACKQLTDTNKKLIGVVVNDTKQDGSYYAYLRK